MIFQLLRQIFRDSKFEQTKIQLAEARSVLSEYKEIVREQTQKVQEKTDKPDIEFITLLWASIGFATAIGGNAIEKIPTNVSLISTPQQVIWLIITLMLMMFVIVNTVFAVDLTKKYTSYKQDKRYVIYYQTLSTAIIVYIAGAILLVLLEGLP
jgi:hypothetical protein